MIDHEKKPVLQSVANALDILKLYSDSEPELGISEISKRMQIGKSTAFRLVSTLMYAGFLEQNPENSKYYLGTALLQLSRLVMNRMNIIRDAHPYLVKLSGKIGETVHLVVLNGYNAMFADKVKGTSIANMGSSIGVTIPAHGTASGKVLLSYKSDEEIEDYLLHVKLEQYTLHSLTRPEQVREAIANARINGYAEDLEETEEGLRCLAVPIFNFNGNPAGSISISGASSRMERNWSVYLEEIRAAAAEISQKLGYRQP
ncbi:MULTISPECIES: IclR family transcriptional regulator [Anaerotruncus]|uniref:IclR family transcriptional regulator n=1 Tax=Anaerotruncus TaxID=244127 RepID=UPI0008371334|nr:MULTISPECIES: IclR family transcriptional regulator [Anaerotruncus]